MPSSLLIRTANIIITYSLITYIFITLILHTNRTKASIHCHTLLFLRRTPFLTLLPLSPSHHTHHLPPRPPRHHDRRAGQHARTRIQNNTLELAVRVDVAVGMWGAGNEGGAYGPRKDVADALGEGEVGESREGERRGGGEGC